MRIYLRLHLWDLRENFSLIKDDYLLQWIINPQFGKQRITNPSQRGPLQINT